MGTENESFSSAVTRFRVVTTVDRRIATVRATGEIDVSCAGRLSTALAEVSANGHSEVVLDVVGVDFCDVSGLRAIYDADRRLRDNGGRLRVTGASPMLRRTMELVGLSDLL